jgi:hypothetical protein
MKVQFKYAFKAGLSVRGSVFAVIMLMNLAFIIPGALGILPLAARITAVSLSGSAIAVMMAFNIVGDVSIARRMFTPLYALTPVPRAKTLLSSVIAMTVMDIVTMTFSIISVVWLSLILAGEGIGSLVWSVVSANMSEMLFGLWLIALMIAGYLLFLMIILFCIAMRKSVFYQKPAGWLLAVLTGFGVFYLVSVSTLLLAPFGVVSRYWWFFNITLGGAGLIMYILLTLIQAAVLFVLTSRLMERKMNI